MTDAIPTEIESHFPSSDHPVPASDISIEELKDCKDQPESSSRNKDALVCDDVLLWLEPEQIQIGALPIRAFDALKDESFELLCKSMSATGGNTQPIQVFRRRTETEAEAVVEFELIAGHRRVMAAKANSQKVLAQVITLGSQSASTFPALIENSAREDLSPFEFGRQIQYVIAENPELTLTQLAEQIGRDKSVVSRAVSLASLPKQVVDAFTSIRDLRYADTKPLQAALEKSRDNVLVEAALIKDQAEGLKGPAVVKRLVAAAEDVAPCNTADSIPIKRGEEIVGDLVVTKQNSTKITLHLKASNKQQLALVAAIESCLNRREFRVSSDSSTRTQKASIECDRPFFVGEQQVDSHDI